MTRSDWRGVLAEVDASLERTLAAVADWPDEPAAEPAWDDSLNRIQGRVSGLHHVIERTSQKVAEMEAWIDEPERELTDSLERIAAAARALASGPGRGVK